jgi:hypothetical protein
MDKKMANVKAAAIRIGRLKELTGKTEVKAKKALMRSMGQMRE